MQTDFKQKVENLKTHLNLIKTMKDQQAENQFFALMEKAKSVLGDTHPQMAFFYFEYANYLMNKMEQNMDIFNAGALPKQQDDGLDQIDQCYQQLSQNQEDSAKSQNNNQSQVKGQKKYITEGSQKDKVQNQYNEIVQMQTKERAQAQFKQNQSQNQKNQEENQSDIQICYENLQCALKIYQNERDKYERGQQTYLEKQMIYRLISRIRSRLGDLYMIDEHYPEAVQAYRTVIADNQKIQGHQWKRVLAELHYLIGNAFLYQNKQSCQKIAISQYIKAIEILIKNLQIQQSYDISQFQLPTQLRLKVDRFAYLLKPDDSEVVKEIKDVVNILLDKIQDTSAQLNQKQKYQIQKKKIEQQNKNNVFKEVDKNVKVINLGVFGNRKKTAQQKECINFKNEQKKQQSQQLCQIKDEKNNNVCAEVEQESQNKNNCPEITQQKI